MSKVLKASTGLTGLAVCHNPHHVLSVLYGKIQRALTKMPSDAAYRKYTEKIVTERANLVNSTKDIPALEKAIGCGQVEELIVQAENELILARKMLGWKPWESLVKPAPAKQWDWPPAQIKEPQL
ncbi:NADH dehydrogenase [ubiquinone] 1 alpha subcomplex subunit 5 [Eupeodes corollae]|uniref:NADH dehydrogenase [ubiquinone] 1 alpha subcomplex subunit 5 n=1 Tax=Eupeodes corollae TaxID=290404 RepID=UPI00248F7840|nr:NADH dehydrogenase [ubiquinone] 1 alpha subcomplex subunit 5 [Eupeodes corollae]